MKQNETYATYQPVPEIHKHDKDNVLKDPK